MALIMNPGGDFMSYYNSQHPQEPAPEQPSEVDKLLQAVMQSFQEQPESGVAQPPPAPFNPMAGGWRGALNAVAAPYNQYQAPLIAPTLQYQQQQALQYPQLAAAAKAKGQETRQRNLVQALNAASLLEQRKQQAAYRQAQIDALNNPVTQGMKPGTENVIQVRRRGPSGEPITQMMLKSEAIARLKAGEPIEFAAPYTTQAIPGIGPNGAGFFPWNRYTGEGLGGVAPIPQQGMMTSVTQSMGLLTQTRTALKAFSDLASSMSAGRRFAFDMLRRVPGARAITGWVSPNGELTATALDTVKDTVLRIASGAQTGEQEAARLGALLPQVGEPIQVARGKFAQTFRRLATVLEVQASVRPDLVAPSLVTEVDSLARELEAGAFDYQDFLKRGVH